MRTVGLVYPEDGTVPSSPPEGATLPPDVPAWVDGASPAPEAPTRKQAHKRPVSEQKKG